MRCKYKDCVNYHQGHLACMDCWRSKGLRDYYQPRLPYYDQGRICNLLGRAWEEYARSRLTKRHAVRLLTLIQRAQVLVMEEEISEDGQA